VLLIQISSPEVLGAPLDTITECQEKHCQVRAPLAEMKVWRVWRESQEKWVYFPFCSHEQALSCFPVNALAQA
jgi:hypothetical protein